MSTFAQQSNGDLALTLGKTSILQGANSVAQKLFNRFRLFTGTWFRDTRQGIPYFRAVFVKNPDLNLITQLFRSIILDCPGIASVQSISVVWNTSLRTADCEFVAITDDGSSVIASNLDQPFIVKVPASNQLQGAP